MRTAGVLMPIFSLPTKYGIGTFGKEAYGFVDFLQTAGQSMWQILPLGPTGYGDSPYQSFSSFAGNPYMIDLEMLIEAELLTIEECERVDFGDNPMDIDYEKLYFGRFDLLRKAYKRAVKSGMLKKKPYTSFCKSNAKWLDDYALFMAIKDANGGASFIEWDEDIRLRKKKALSQYKEKYAENVEFYKFQQFLFNDQWLKLKKYANDRGIKIIGDIPIYVAFDSADTWSEPDLFMLDEKGYPTMVAGCPPDCFAETGQLWGNPLYDWEYHKKTDFDWWVRRMEHCAVLYDVVRIDHFRGFDEFWAVPYGDETAVGGRWLKGPGYALFKTLKEKLGDQSIIAEDLGFITDSVRKLIKKTGYPGMKILQFAFEDGGDSEHLPYYCDYNYVVYTGTHDNLTIKDWIYQMPKKDVKFAKKYLNVEKKKQLPKAYIRAAMATNAQMCIIPMGDYLELGAEGRINAPSTLGTNWRWRLDFAALTPEFAAYMRELAYVYGRLPKAEQKAE